MTPIAPSRARRLNPSLIRSAVMLVVQATRFVGSGTSRPSRRASSIHSSITPAAAAIARSGFSTSVMQPGRSGTDTRKPPPSSLGSGSTITAYSSLVIALLHVRSQSSQAYGCIRPLLALREGSPKSASNLDVIPCSAIRHPRPECTSSRSVGTVSQHPQSSNHQPDFGASHPAETLPSLTPPPASSAPLPSHAARACIPPA
jgi:hypothetical protein